MYKIKKLFFEKSIFERKITFLLVGVYNFVEEKVCLKFALTESSKLGSNCKEIDPRMWFVSGSRL